MVDEAIDIPCLSISDILSVWIPAKSQLDYASRIGCNQHLFLVSPDLWGASRKHQFLVNTLPTVVRYRNSTWFCWTRLAKNSRSYSALLELIHALSSVFRNSSIYDLADFAI